MKGNTLTPNEIAFTYYDDTDGTFDCYKQDVMAAQFKEVADYLVNSIPASRELSLALTNLQQAFHWADAAMDPRLP